MNNSDNQSSDLPHNAIELQDTRLEDLRIKAKKDIGEVNELIPQQVQKLMDLIAKENPHLLLHPSSYDVYLKCLRAKKYDLPRAAKLYYKFCQIRHGCIGDVLNKCLPTSQFQPLYDKGFSTTLKFRDDFGRQIVLLRIEKWDLSEATFEQTLGSLSLMMDEITSSEDTQLQGIVCIGDCKGLSLGHVRSISLAKIQAMFQVVQDSYPARFKEYHILNNPFIFNMLYSCAKPFMKEKMKKRVFIHGYNMESLHKSIKIKRNLLPKFLGGDVPNDEYADTSVVERIFGKDPHYREFLKYGH